MRNGFEIGVLTAFLAGLLISCASQPSQQVVDGTMEDLPAHLDRLLAVPVENSPILIISLEGSESDFIQFSVGDDEVELDHPLVSSRQQAREATLRRSLQDAGCEPVINVGTNGARFMDCYLPRSSDEVLRVTTAVLRDLFAVENATPLVFTSYGI